MSRIPGRIVVELDDRASQLVRDYLKTGHPCLDGQRDPRDVVSAAVMFPLEEPGFEHDWGCGDEDHESSPECFEAARSARLGKEVA